MTLLKQEIYGSEEKSFRKVFDRFLPEECNEIRSLFERRNGLNEMVKILTPDNDALYEKLVKDLGETATKFEMWWRDMSEKYQWEGVADGNWQIDFNTGEIYLVVG